MAGLLDKYGIKEVADVTFYAIDAQGKPSHPVLFLDTLKVSTIEQTAEQTEARGGKGNPPLIIWDYGKEINVSLEDALFSPRSMAVMFGNGRVKNYNGTNKFIMRTETFRYDASDPVSYGLGSKFKTPDGTLHDKKHLRVFNQSGDEISTTKTYTSTSNSWPEISTILAPSAYFTSPTDVIKDGELYVASYDLDIEGSVIEISANSFPGTYYVTGDTFARSQVSGKDEFFQFIIPRAKVSSENTITMEAEGDPSVFNMNLRVLRTEDGGMIKLVKYDVDASDTYDADIEAALDTADKLTRKASTYTTSAGGAGVGTVNGYRALAVGTSFGIRLPKEVAAGDGLIKPTRTGISYSVDSTDRKNVSVIAGDDAVVGDIFGASFYDNTGALIWADTFEVVAAG